MTLNRFARISLLCATVAGLTSGARVAAQFPGGGAQAPREVVSQFDKDGDKRLNAAERKAAREGMGTQGGGRGFRAALVQVATLDRSRPVRPSRAGR